MNEKSTRKKFIIKINLQFLSMLLFSLGTMGFLFPNMLINYLPLNYVELNIFSISVIIISTAIILNTYLATKTSYYDKLFNFKNSDIITSVDDTFGFQLKKEVNKKYYPQNPLLNYYLKQDEKNNNVKTEKIFDNDLIKLKDAYVQRYYFEFENFHAFNDLYKTENNIKKHIERLIKNSNINLTIGVITSILAVFVLSLSIFQIPHSIEHNNYVNLFEYFIPRISTAIFIEVFSFFFLRLYKNNLEEIKYFQNELTNINFKLSALKTTILKKENISLPKIVENYCNIERNKITEKDEATQSPTNIKYENNIAEKIISVLSKINNK